MTAVTYYDRSVLKPPVWKPEIPFYFFSGGLAGGSSMLACLASAGGNSALARRSWLIALGSVSVSPLLLIADLGRPSRFLNMLRVFKATSPMSVGSWLLVANSGAIGLAAALNLLQPERRARVPEAAAAALGGPLATYTAVLISNSAIPAWSEARAELPFVFAAGAAASAGAAAAIATDPAQAAPARRLGIGGALAEEAVTMLMHRRLGDLARSYEEGTAGRCGRLARGLTLAGAGLLAARGRERRGAVAGGALALAGAALHRWAIFRAGFQSAGDAAQTVRMQRARMAARDAEGGLA